MGTLIAVYTSDGCVGRCDAKCYMATQPKCECVCGGLNHGVGLHRAAINTREITFEQIRPWAKEHGYTGANLAALTSPPLFSVGA